VTWEITAGFWLMAALLYYLDGDGLLPWAALACALHEAGHILVIRLLGGRIRRLRLTATGAELRLAPLPPERLLPAALAGPGANLLAAVFSARLARYLGGKLYLFAGLNLGLALFNLLPAACLDGGRALEAGMTLLWSEWVGRRVVLACSILLSVLMCLGGWSLLWRGRNFTLLFAGLWLGTMTRKENRVL